jgi:hypothetical protein
MRGIQAVLVVVGAVMFGSSWGGGPAAQTQGGVTRNVQVLPKDWTPQQVQQFMRTFVAPGLGVMCSHCHVADRSSDEKKEKVLARKMLQMMVAINDQHLKDVGDPAVTQKVTCFTCHRGVLKPVSAPATDAAGS